MVQELQASDRSRLRGTEREALSTLLARGLRCREDKDLLIAFSGD
jgi:hypothetical protein